MNPDDEAAWDSLVDSLTPHFSSEGTFVGPATSLENAQQAIRDNKVAVHLAEEQLRNLKDGQD